MPLLHCSNCHHEYYGNDHEEICDWCGSTGYIIEQQTSLEKMCQQIEETGAEDWLKKIMETEHEEKTLDNYPVFVYDCKHKLHLSSRKQAKISCGLTNCGIGKFDK